MNWRVRKVSFFNRNSPPFFKLFSSSNLIIIFLLFVLPFSIVSVLPFPQHFFCCCYSYSYVLPYVSFHLLTFFIMLWNEFYLLPLITIQELFLLFSATTWFLSNHARLLLTDEGSVYIWIWEEFVVFLNVFLVFIQSFFLLFKLYNEVYIWNMVNFFWSHSTLFHMGA